MMIDILIRIIGIFVIIIVFWFFLSKYEKNYNAKSISFSNDKFVQYINSKIRNKSNISLLSLYVFNDDNEYRKEIIINKMIDEIYYLKRNEYKVKFFRISNNEMILCSKDRDLLKEISLDLKRTIEIMQSNYNFANRSNCVLVYLENLNNISSYIELNGLLNSSKLLSSKSLLDVDIINVDSDMITKLKEENKMVKTIDYALDNDKVTLHYQPVYSVKEDKIVSCEVLVRIKDENGKTIMPNSFIGVAEKYDRIASIGKKTLDVACKFFNEVNKDKKVLDDISINFSSHEIEDYRTINNIIDAIKENELNPKNLCIEIASANDYKNEEDYLYNINKLSSFGVSISLTGYGNNKSNLNYIIGYPIDTVRFDRQYVWDSLKNPNNKAIFDSVIQIAKDYYIKTVAVGVEDEEQYKRLIESDVDYLQGIYFSPPLPKNSFIELVNSRDKE